MNASIEKRYKGAAAESIIKGENVEPDRHESPKQNLTEGGKPLSQELTCNDSEGEVTTKNPVVLSDDDGPSQTVAINNANGVQNFTNVRISQQCEGVLVPLFSHSVLRLQGPVL